MPSAVQHESSATQAEALPSKADSSERTAVITGQCREAFDAMTGTVRFFKGCYCLAPPLANVDMVNLCLSLHNTHPTPAPEVTLETYLTGRHERGVKLVYVSGNPNDRENKGYRIWYKTARRGTGYQSQAA
ncbi:MAG: hypothetical protein LBP76_03530 [Treponema sp.]|jgi:hypothetical protein|nr:hypothetical protein [Treponema sp.]